MKNISFSMTTAAFLAGQKTVTRRLGWRSLKPGDRLMAVEKGQGLKRGEKVKCLGEILVLSVSWEPVFAITAEDVAREGYPGMSREAFVEKFCAAMHCDRADEVTRIEFRRVGVAPKEVVSGIHV